MKLDKSHKTKAIEVMNMLKISYKVANGVMDMVLNIFEKEEEKYERTSIKYRNNYIGGKK